MRSGEAFGWPQVNARQVFAIVARKVPSLGKVGLLILQLIRVVLFATSILVRRRTFKGEKYRNLILPCIGPRLRSL